MFKKFAVATLALSLVLPAVATVTATNAEARITKKEKRACWNYADRRAKKKANKNVVGGMIVGGAAGALLGSAIGGKKTTIGMGAGGAALGLATGASRYDYYFEEFYAGCLDEADED